MPYRTITYLFAVTLLWCSCSADEDVGSETLFRSIDVKSAGIDFANQLSYTEEFNVYTFRNFYNGAGVGLGDFNRDGLLDIFFCGNQVDNELYFNKGDLAFENVTEIAGVASKNVWTTGVSIADINGDGWLDIYVCKSGDSQGANRYNELFINEGLNADGDVTFIEQSKAYGLDDIGLATHAAFLDYDLDGDLDCYLLNNSFRSIGNYDLRLDQREIRDTLGGNKLLRNNTIGNSSSVTLFEDVSEEAGIYGSSIGFGLGVTFGDVNQDGYPDIYVSNDFFEKDYLYINNQDGTFNENSEELIREMSMGSMGADMADINNDGLQDIFVTEMLPRNEQRKKTKSIFEDWNKYKKGVDQGYHQQFARNVLQVNTGGGRFAEVGRLAGVEATDWSWGALFFDADNDGWKDLFVANGIYKDLLDQDYINFYSNPEEVRKILFDKDKGGLDKLVDMIPSEAISNYVFKNQAGRTFQDMTTDWGMSTPSFSNGAAYGDLDNDGDLDLIVNNINAVPTIYENEVLNEISNYLQITLNDTSALNFYAIGATVTVHYKRMLQSIQINPARGFMSTSDARAHFGLGKADLVDSVVVQWPDLTQSVIIGPELNKEIIVTKTGKEASTAQVRSQSALFKISSSYQPKFKHIENQYADFDRENLLLEMKSNVGPALCEGDINGDGLLDFYMGGAKGQAGVLLVQKAGGNFIELSINNATDNTGSEEVDCIFYNANNDDLLDLYIVNGSSEFSANNIALADRLYFNKGDLKFEKSLQILPTFNFENTSSVAAIDFDNDQDMDLVVSAFIKPYNYGLSSNTYILENDGIGNYKDVTKAIGPELLNIGMTTSVAVVDIDGDQDDDILIAGEWMQIKVLLNDDAKFSVSRDSNSLLPSGLWSTIEVADIDGDGDQDIVVGNHGLNSRLKASSTFPMNLYLNDFDQNGKVDQIFTYLNETGEYPLAQRGDLLRQLPYLKKKYPDYRSYGGKEIAEIFDLTQLEKGLKHQLTELRSCILWNNGQGKLELAPLPDAAQIAPVYAIQIVDLNDDGRLDIILGGNQSKSKPELGIYMGSYGTVLLNQGGQQFSSIDRNSSGIMLEGEVRGIKNIGTKKQPLIVVARNNAQPIIYKKNEANN